MKSIKVNNHLSQRGPLFNLLRHSALFFPTYPGHLLRGLLIKKASSVRILPITELLIAPQAWMQVINIEHHRSRASHQLPMFFKVKEVEGLERSVYCSAQTSNGRECLANHRSFYDCDSLLQWHKCQETDDTCKTAPCDFNTAAPLCSYLNTNSFHSQRQYLLCTKEPSAQIDRLPGAKFLLDFLALPRANCKENISGKEWTKPAKTSCWPGRVITYGSWKMSRFELLTIIYTCFCDQEYWRVIPNIYIN